MDETLERIREKAAALNGREWEDFWQWLVEENERRGQRAEAEREAPPARSPRPWCY